MSRQFEQRRLGRSGVMVSALGLGTASLAGNMFPVPETDARATIDHAIQSGITYVDTAPFYGFGKAEHMVGDAIRSHRDSLTLSSKCGRLLAPQTGPYGKPNSWREPYPFVDVFDYSYDGLMRSFEDSLQRLATNRIDILLVHDVAPDTLGDAAEGHFQTLERSGYRALEELKRTGRIGAIGIGVNMWEVLDRALEIGDWDAFLLAGRYTLLEQTSLSPFLDKCVARQTSIICGGPFNSGLLAGGDTWNYDKAPAEVVDKARALQTICEAHGVVLPAAALQFPLAHPAVACVLPGPRTVAELDQILGWWDQDLPQALWSDLATSGLLRKGTPLPGGPSA
ncbi:MAG: aldo/keto reductase [Hyphomicrobiaceae bacterium]|nr:aldo/keto reductase [Hyphomicrobiaceae bacterium]MCC0024814.1 aldo/keto reductase [Hyphomicrobiaceae bacterium]